MQNRGSLSSWYPKEIIIISKELTTLGRKEVGTLHDLQRYRSVFQTKHCLIYFWQKDWHTEAKLCCTDHGPDRFLFLWSYRSNASNLQRFFRYCSSITLHLNLQWTFPTTVLSSRHLFMNVALCFKITSRYISPTKLTCTAGCTQAWYNSVPRGHITENRRRPFTYHLISFVILTYYLYFYLIKSWRTVRARWGSRLEVSN